MARKSLLFRKDSEGRLVFYPWLFPGQGFFLDDNNRKNITTTICIFALSFITIHIALELSRHYAALPPTAFAYLKIVSWILFPVAYFYKAREMTRDLTPQEQTSTAKPLIFYVLLYLILNSTFAFIAALYVARIEPVIIPILPIIGIYTFALIKLTIHTHKNRGF